MTRIVICGVDHSPRSDSVVDAAATLAEGLDARLLLAHSRQASSVPLGRATPHAGMAGWPPLEPDTETSAEDLLGDLISHGRRGATDTVVRSGDPGGALCDLAKDSGATLVVVGSRGRGPLRTFLLGSVSTEVIRHAPCPVMVVPDAALGRVERPVVDGSTVLCGVGSREDRRLVGLAADLAAALGLRLRVAHVRPTGSRLLVVAVAGAVPPTVMEPGHVPRVPDIAMLLQELLEEAVEARPQLTQCADWSLWTGMPGAGLEELAESSHAAAIVVGTGSDGTLRGGLLRSPAWMLAREATVPVVIAREGVKAGTLAPLASRP